jgi:hypothetical protein
MTQTRMFNPREYFGAAFIGESANLRTTLDYKDLFDNHQPLTTVDWHSRLNRQAYSSVKI